VADFGRVLAAPYCTMLLADMGATVLKVESPAGDETRAWMPPVHEEESTYYLSVNRNKHSIALNLNEENDLEVARALAAKCDVFVENFKPGGLSRFHLDYESVRSLNENVIYASITGFGTKGGADLPGYDLLVQGAAGLMSLTGDADTEPFRAGVAVFDVVTGLHTAIAILAALYHRSQTGQGQLVELNLMSAALSSMVNQTGAFAIAKAIPERLGNEHPSIFPYSPFPTADGSIILAIGNDAQFETFVRLLNASVLLEDERFQTNASRSLNREILRPLLEDIMRTRSTEEWFIAMRDAGLPCAPINNVAQGVQFAEQLGLDPIVLTGTGNDQQPTIRNPMIFDKTPVTYDFRPPKLNSAGDTIRAWLKQ